MPRETLIFDPIALSRLTARRCLQRGELAKEAGISHARVTDAFAGRPVTVKTARCVASALGTKLEKLIDETETRIEGAKKTA